jgi:hypothetical protein
MDPIKQRIDRFMKKLGRNDPCHCGSGKKFKKCCESKMIGGRYIATKIEPQAAKATGLAGLFNRQISAIAKPSAIHKPIRATGPAAPASPAAPETTPPKPPASSEKVE